MNKLEKFLFQLTIFLIPTNLAYHFITKQSYINGILVDYLIPKLYLSDIPILILLFLWLIKSWKAWSKQKIKKNIILYSLFFILLLKGFFSEKPLSATWFWLKLTQLSLFFFWIKAHLFKGKSHTKLYKLIFTPLTFSLLFQSILGIYQFIFQKSMAGYWFLGESTLTHTSNIAKDNFSMLPFIKNGLKILPYGTTPHPNVLAGSLSIGMVFLLLFNKEKVKIKPYQNLLLPITFFFSFTTLLLTLSGSAWISFIIGVSIIKLLSKFNKPKIKQILIPLILISSIIFIIFTRDNLLTDNYSISRRRQLNQIAWQMFQHHPLSGVGLNNFTARIGEFGTIHTYTSFIQPPHNIFMLWLSETGFLGLILIFFILKKMKTQTTHYSLLTTVSILMILIIGLIDHYPLTIQTGQLIALLSLSNIKFAKKMK